MTNSKPNTPAVLLAAMFAAAFLCLPQVSSAAALPMGAGVQGQNQAQGSGSATSDAAARLDKKDLRNVQVSVDDHGVATLTGTVDYFSQKADAQKRVLKAKGVLAVRNRIEVAGGNVSDQELQAKLGAKLAYDRVGYPDVIFNAITLNVQNGVVTLGGHARADVDKESALDLVSNYRGVKDVVDNIQVDPASIMDDQARRAVAQAIYGYPTLGKYATDPAKPIRISVQNGNVELYGTVDNEGDKEIANLRANGVAGVFSVKNYLQVANQPTESHN
ncbi:MAG: BON domain-containing protein [Terracidiphilus sp.]|jgi:osmotically-inducible protein OsmY